MSKAKLLIVEDELVIALGLAKSLEKLGYEVIGMANTGEEAVRIAHANAPDLVLMDIILAGAMDGIEAARMILKDADIPIVYLTANADRATVERARDTVPYGYLNKPINDRDLLTNIDSALNKHRMERRLRESEEKYRNLINSLQDVIVSTDENGIITYISPRIKDIAGYEENEMVGKAFLSFVYPGDREKVIHIFGLSRSGSPESGEYRGVTKSGGVIWLRTSGRPSYVDGRFKGVKVIISDITTRKQAEEEAMRANDELTAANEELQATVEELEALNEQFEEQNRELMQAKEDLSRQEAMLRNIVRVVPVGIGYIRDRVIVWVNSTYSAMLGYTENDVIGKGLRMYYASDDEYHAAVREMIDQIATRGWASFEVRARRKDGSAIDILINTVPFEKDNLDAGIVFASMDRTEQKLVEMALRESEERYRLLIENMSDSVWVLDLKTMEFIYNSPSSVRILVYTPEESHRHKITDIVLPKYLEMIGKKLNEELLRDGQPGVDPDRSLTLQLEQIHKKGHTVWTEMNLRFLRDASGRPISILGVSRDVTERKRAEQAQAESDEKYRVLAESISDMIWTLDVRTRRFLYANFSSEELTGYTPDEMLLLTLDTILTPESMDTAMDILGEEIALEGTHDIDPRRSRTFEAELKHKSGSVLWIEITARFLRDESGVPLQVLGLAHDITKRKRIELALAEREEKYRLLMENSPESLWVIDLKTMRFVYTSSNGAHNLGYSSEETPNLTIKDIVTPESLAHVGRILKEELERDGRPGVDPNRVLTIEIEQIHKNGSLLWIETTGKFLRDESGRPYSILGASRDVTPRKYAEELLLLQRDLARALSATSSLDDAMALCLEMAIKGSKMDSGGVYLMDQEQGGMKLVCHRGLNDEFVTKYSYFGPETDNNRLVMEGKSIYFSYSDIKKIMSDSEYQEQLMTVAIIPIVHKGSVVANINVSSHARDNIPAAARTILEGIAAQMGDVIIRLEMQDALKKSEEKFRMIIEYSPYPIGLVDNDSNTFTYFNKSLIKTLGYTIEDIPDMDAWEQAAYPDEAYRTKTSQAWKNAIQEAFARGTWLKSDEVDVRCKDGSYRHVEIRFMPVGPLSIFIINDLTEKKIHQEMLIQTEKMTSLGGLAAGMAHEINNPLGIILQGIQAVLNRLSTSVEKNREEAIRAGTNMETILAYLTKREIMEYLNGIQDAGQRAAKIVSNMLQFSRRSESLVGPVDINLLIDKTLEIASSDYDLKKKYDFKKVRIVREYDPDLGMVPCSETGIEQVILNLLKNSSQAMSAIKKKDYHPTITIRTSKEMSHAVITISDNGPGIDPGIQRHIFEPFYTTKGVGMGTGLGLSVSYYIITKTHDGTIDVTSNPGKGAVFTIKLPLVRLS
jgi:PAS domain S-box-containing protein